MTKTAEIMFDATVTVIQTIEILDDSTPESIVQGLRDGSLVTTIDGSDGETMYVYGTGPDDLEPVAVILEQRFEDADLGESIDYEIVAYDPDHNAYAIVAPDYDDLDQDALEILTKGRV